MTVKERIAKIKAKFDGTTPAAPAVNTDAPTDTTVPGTNKTGANVISYAVDGAQPVFVDISDDNINGIEQGDAVYSDQALTIPYPDGTYNVTGTTFGFMVSGGSVSSVTDPAATGAGTPMQDASQTPPPAVVAPTMEERLSAIEQALAKLQAPVTTGLATEVQLQAASQKITDQDIIIKKQDEKIVLMLELVESLVELPAADQKALTANQKAKAEKFSAKDQRLNSIADAMKKRKQLQ